MTENACLKPMDGRSTKINCKRCGKCCLANFIAYVTNEDLNRWQREGRDDILHVLEQQNGIWAGDHLISVNNGHSLHGCPFLKGETGYYTCTIYETRPRVCREYVPGSSELCPQYYRE